MDGKIIDNVPDKNGVDNSGESGIIETGNVAESAGMIKLSSKFVNSNDMLYVNADKIKPIDGYDDIVVHGSPTELVINGSDGEEWTYNAKEAADMIRNAADYHNRPIRLISCQTGAGDDCIAQQIADELGVEVLAPTEIVNVDFGGNMFVCDNDIIARAWVREDAEGRKAFCEPGKWVKFYPRKR